MHDFPTTTGIPKYAWRNHCRGKRLRILTITHTKSKHTIAHADEDLALLANTKKNVYTKNQQNFEN